MQFEPTSNHQWLKQFVGTWTFESDCLAGPDQPPEIMKGRETTRCLGDAWVVCESVIDHPEAGPVSNLMTLGFDPQKQKFVGTFIASVMGNLWVYEGTLDPTGKILTLDTRGPSCTGDGLCEYQDIYEIVDDDHRTLTSQLKGPDGSWVRFMTAHYHREK